MNTNHELVETLANSELYHDYERAYGEVTGLPLTLRPVETWQLGLHGQRRENPFCALMAAKSRTCAACLQMQDKLCQDAREKSATMTCDYGLCETAVPVRLGNETIAFLQTGQVFRQPATASQFNRVADALEEQGLGVAREELKASYFQTPVVPQKKMDSAAHLLGVFADQLSTRANQIAMAKSHAESPVITRAKQYILEHFTEELSLNQVAAAVHTSSFYFCKLFKKSTGINFTEFVSRTRIEKAKNLLLNPNLRISEIAYEIGFQSLTHFNRVFKKITGQSPTEYRGQLPAR
jgi:AraC-like DNA-binding protein/ligand-binding sensor protein